MKSILAVVALCLFAFPAFGQGPLTTTVADTIYAENGSTQTGSLVISNPRFTSPDGYAIAASSQTVNLNSNGTFSVALVPTFGGTPAGTYYTVQVNPSSGLPRTEQWSVPYFPTALTISQIIVTGPGTPIPPLSGDVVGSFITSQVVGLHFGTSFVGLSSTAPINGDCLTYNSTTGQAGFTAGCSGGGGGGVSSFSAQTTVSPLFTTSVSNPTTTPLLSFSLTAAAGNTIFGNCSGSSATPSYCGLTTAMMPAGFCSGIGGVAGQVFESTGSGCGVYADPIVSGPDAVGATPTRNPVAIGCLFLTAPATLTNNQIGEAACDSTQHLLVDVLNSTLAATQSGNWTSRIVGNAGGTLDAAQNTAAPANALAAGCVYNSSFPSITSGNLTQFQCDSNGRLAVDLYSFNGTSWNPAGPWPADNSAFTAGTTVVGVIAGWYSSSPTACTSGDLCAPSLTSDRKLFVQSFQGTSPWVDSITAWGGGTLGAMANYGTSPGAVLVPGVNAFITNTPAVTGSGNFTVVQTTGTNLHIVCDSGCSSSAGFADNSVFTVGTTAINPIGGLYDTGADPSISNGNAGRARIDSHSYLFNDLTALAGTVLGAPSNYGTGPGAVEVLGVNAFITNTPAVSQSGTWTVQQGGAPWSVSGSGSFTVVQATGTNLHMVCDSGCSSSAGFADNSAFTVGTTAINPIGGLYDTGTDPTLTNGSAARVRIDSHSYLFTDWTALAGTVLGAPSNYGTSPGAVEVQGVNAFITNTPAVSQSGTWTIQPGNTANTTAWLVTGTGGTFPATESGTWTVTQSGNWTSRIVGNAGGILDAAQNTAASANALQVGGVYNSSLPSITSGNLSALQIDSSGRLIVSCGSGCGGSGGTSLADEGTFTQGTTSFTPIGGYYNSTITNLTSGQGGAAQLTNTRHLMVNLADALPAGSNAIGGVTQSGTWTVQPGNTANTTPWLVTAEMQVYNGSSWQNATPYPADNSAFTAGTTPAGLIAGWYASSPTACTSGNLCAPSLTSDRKLFVQDFQGTSPWVVSANGGTFAVTQSGNWTARIVGNAGASVDAATGAAPPANAILNGFLGSGATGGDVIAAPVSDTPKNINISTATTTLLVTGVSGRQVRIGFLHLYADGADNIAWIEGTGAACGTGTAGMRGGTTAATGETLLANQGYTEGTGFGTVLETATAGDSVCLITSAAVQLSGNITYTIY